MPEQDLRDLREKLAELEHEQWAHWTEYLLKTVYDELFDRFDFFAESGVDIDILDCVERWRRQIETPYAELTEEEKDSDREWADKVLAIVNS